MQIQIEDGTLAVSVKRGDEFEETKLDYITLHLGLDALERKHQLPIVDGIVQPTVEFVKELAQWLRSEGMPDCTPTMAWNLWRGYYAARSQLKKSTDELLTLPIGTN